MQRMMEAVTSIIPEMEILIQNILLLTLSDLEKVTNSSQCKDSWVQLYSSAFSLIMFAYSGSASFPTYQSDMKDRRDFPKAVLGAMTSKDS